MKDDLRDLYQEVILDHGRRPRNLRPLSDANRQANGHNPMCGDTLTVFLKVDKVGLVREATFDGHGCAISVASASMMTEILAGKSEEEARALFHAFQAMCTGDSLKESGSMLLEGLQDALERLQVLSGVRRFPVRVKCATLAWHTMAAAVDGTSTASTE
ncbi:Putative iron-sulfur cluster assembly scaffold protein for SUF system, SufE2 [invertebrate metagenome]|uniref:Iron-sulfur cluster assembly scaffold protein for SUF system, SufE2 n=1 Tax=invertebrate metagenome TaxID=1711999 RepID=A0A484H7Z5_9ZZZZ